MRYERFRPKQDKTKRRIIEKFASELAKGDEQEQSFGNYLSRMLANIDEASATSSASSSVAGSPPVSLSSTRILSDDVDAFPDVDHLAEQIALAEHRLFAKVRPSDLHKGNWLEAGGETNAVAAWSEHSNRLSRWAATKVLRQATKVGRAKIVGKIIQLIEVR
jgi:hypothetical protein